MQRCMNCMKEYSEDLVKCPHCGFHKDTPNKEPYHLKPGTIVDKKYIIGNVIGFGGFGVIYKAWDQALERVVAVKEYFPTAFLARVEGKTDTFVFDQKNQEMFLKGKTEFLEEARNLAKFNQHPIIVNIFDYFEENGTAYFVMEYLDGVNLRSYVSELAKRGKKLSVESSVMIVQSVLGALKAVHSSGILHRDIKPGNIFVCKNGTIKLIDFGAAKFSDTDAEKTKTVIITTGYAPVEQYQTHGKQGAYTDIYAIGAVLYELVTGIKPDESINRKVDDIVEDPMKINPEVTQVLNNAIMRAMAVKADIRFQSVDDFSKAISAKKAVRSAKSEMKYRATKRNMKVALIVVLLFGIGLFAWKTYNSEKDKALLIASDIDIWTYFSNDEQKRTEEMYDLMLDEFQEKYPQINITVHCIAEDEYKETIESHLEKEDEIDLFASDCFAEEECDSFMSLNDFWNYSEFDISQYYLLDKLNNKDAVVKRLPICSNIPILYGNILHDNLEVDTDYQKYVEQKNTYLGNVDEYEAVLQDMAGVYSISLTDDDFYFDKYWSISGKSTEEEVNAALRILYYFLSETSQEEYTVENNNGLPLNKNVFDIFLEVNPDFNILAEKIDK